MNHMENHIIESNTTSDNISFLVDNKNCLCQPEKLHPITARKGESISEKMYKYLGKSFNKTHLYKSLQLKWRFANSEMNKL